MKMFPSCLLSECVFAIWWSHRTGHEHLRLYRLVFVPIHKVKDLLLRGDLRYRDSALVSDAWDRVAP